MIKIKKVSFAYQGQKDIIKNININIKPREFICIVGENGSGKSTLIKCILGLNKVTNGSIDIQERVGYLPQITDIQNNFPATVEEVVLSGTLINSIKKIFYTKKDKEFANEIMKDLKILDIKNKCFSDLSGGQKQRVLIARALCSTDKILILDEPVNGLDPKIVHQIYKLLLKLNKEKDLTIIMISHDIDRALEYCTRVIEITKGEISFDDISSKYKIEVRKNDRNN